MCYASAKQKLLALAAAQAETLADKRIVVAIDGWDADSAYPSGHYVRTLGLIGDRETETEVLLLENDINTAPFSPAVHACVPPLPWSVTQADLADPNRSVSAPSHLILSARRCDKTSRAPPSASRRVLACCGQSHWLHSFSCVASRWWSMFSGSA